MSPISSCMSLGRSVASIRQPKDITGKVKRAMCHSLVGRFFCTALLCLLAIYGPAARAQTSAGIEQTFANSLTTIPAENLGVAGAFYVPAYSIVSMSQGKTL